MTFTVLFAAVALLLLGGVFVAAYKWKGLIAALVATGITLVLEIVGFYVMVMAITSSM